MKKVLIGIIIAISCIGVIILGLKMNLKSSNPSNPSSKNEIYNKLDDNDLSNTNVNTVTLVDNKATEDIEYNGVKIQDISISPGDVKEIYMNISSTGTDLSGKTLTVVLLNPNVVQSANEKSMILNNNANNGIIINMDVTKIYNNPVQLKFIIE